MVTVDANEQLLVAGDAYYITSNQPYRMRNMNQQDCIVVTSNNTARF
jgi:mannose-6-phosphate isomerase-like protein (cupin superfamily)